MKNIFKKLFLGTILVCGSFFISNAQSDTITDGGDYIRFKASTYSISDIPKANIASIEVASASECKIITKNAAKYSSGERNFFTVAYNEWTNGQTAFTDVFDLETFLVNIWQKRYYHSYSYDVDDNLIQHVQSWIHGTDTVEVLSDTLTYSGGNLITITAE